MSAVVLVACVAPLPAQVGYRDLKSGKKQIHTVALTPIFVDLTKVSMKGSEPMVEEARESSLALMVETAAALRDLGYQVDLESLSSRSLAKDADQRYAVDDLQKKFDAELEVIHRKSNDVRKGRFTLGDAVARLVLTDNIDALLFVRVRGRVLTDSKKAMGIFFGTFSSMVKGDEAWLDFGLVDARTGRVLYFAKATAAGNMMEDCDWLAEAIRSAFRDLPKARIPSPASTKNKSSTVVSGATSTVVESDKTSPSSSTLKSSAEGQNSNPPPTWRIHLSQQALKYMLIKKVKPEYPGIASVNKIEGDVILRAIIDREGRVADVHMLAGPVELAQATTSAVKQWRYHPLSINGQVYEVETQIVFTFTAY